MTPPLDQSTDARLVTAITAIVQHADARFVCTDGSARHWVRDCFLPALNRHGWRVTDEKGSA